MRAIEHADIAFSRNDDQAFISDHLFRRIDGSVAGVIGHPTDDVRRRTA
jgi:hypothetical protein